MGRDHAGYSKVQKCAGLFYREPLDNVPPDHLINALNVVYSPNGAIKTREVFAHVSTHGNPGGRIPLYKTNNTDDSVTTSGYGPNYTRPIVCMSPVGASYLLDLLRFPLLPFFDGISGDLDLTAVSLYNKWYISWSVGDIGSPYGLRLYNGIHPTLPGGIYRIAGGTAAATTLTSSMAGGPFTTSRASYIFAVLYETDTGFIRAPANFLLNDRLLVDSAYFEFWGANLTLNFGVGPTGTIARWIIGTKAIFNSVAIPPANAANYPFFFIKRIPDNTTTSTTVGGYGYDNSLINAADHIFKQLPTPPAGKKVTEYNGRLVIMAPAEDRNKVLFSKASDPESFNSTSGFKVIEPADPSGCKNGLEWRGNFYILKGRSTHVTQDNGGEASTWQVTQVDNGIGTPSSYGIAQILGTTKGPSEGFLVANESGIFLFNGVYQKPALTWKIETLWRRINKAYFFKMELHVHPERQLIYALVPLDTSSSNNYIIVGDFSESLDPQGIKWSYWIINGDGANSMSIFEQYNTKEIRVYSNTQTGFIFTLLPHDTLGQDYGSNNIIQRIKYPQMPTEKNRTTISHFSRLMLDIVGSGSVAWRYDGKNGVAVSPLVPLNLVTTNTRTYNFLSNFQDEYVQVYLETGANTRIEVRALEVEYAPLWSEYPR